MLGQSWEPTEKTRSRNGAGACHPHLLSISHEQEYYDGDTTTQGRKVRAALKRLSDLGVVVRLSRRVGGVRAGSEGFVVGLTEMETLAL